MNSRFATIRKRRASKGQAMLEFSIIAAMMLGVVAALFLFLAVFTEWGWRVLRLIGLEYP